MAVLIDLPLSGPNGSTTFTDNTGRVWTRPATSGNNAQIQDNALLLDGNGDYLSTPGDSSLTFGPMQFRIEFDMKTTHDPSLGTMPVLDYGSNNSYGWLLGVRSSTAQLGLYSPAGGYVLSSLNAVNDGTWRHVVLEQNGGRVRFIIDGVTEPDAGAGSNAFTAQAASLLLGNSTSTAVPFYNGSIKNLKFSVPDPAQALAHRPVIRRSYVGWDNVVSTRGPAMMPVYEIPPAAVRRFKQVQVTRGVPPWWGMSGSTSQLPTYKIRGRVMQRDPETLEDTPVQNVRVALFFRRLHTLVDIQLSDANGYVQFDNLMPGVQAYYGIAIDSDNAPMQNSIIWDRLSSEPGP